jgi:hypothetical protein
MPATGAKAKTMAKSEPSTLLEKIEASESQHATCKRQKPKRDIEGHIDKLIKDNFQGWGPQQVDCVSRGGLTLRQRLLRDTALSQKGELPMGKHYYVSLRALFEDPQSPSKLLRVANPSDPVNDKLKASLVELTAHRTNYKAFTAFLEEDVVDNQKTVVAVFGLAWTSSQRLARNRHRLS